MLKLIYTLFLGVLLALFIGLGINTFYPGPKAPEYPVELNSTGKELTSEEIAIERSYTKQQRTYEEKNKPYSRNVSIAALIAAVILLTLSLVLEKRLSILADGIMFGGLFTLLYSIIRGFVSEENKYVFVVVTIGLVTVLYLGYHKFIRSQLMSTIAIKTTKP